MKKIAVLILFTAAAWAQGGSGGPPAKSCVSTPGNTTGVYRQECQTTAGARYACNQTTGCTTAGQWVLVGPGAASGAGWTDNGTTISAASGRNVSIGNTVLCAAPISVSGQSLTLLSTHNGCTISFTSATPVTVTVPSGLPAGFSATLLQLGAAIVSPVASGSTFTTAASTAGVGSAVGILGVGTNTYVMAATAVNPTIATGSVLKGSGGNAIGAGASDVVSLFGGGACSGYLKSDGTCDAVQNLVKSSEDITQAYWNYGGGAKTSAHLFTVSSSGSNNVISYDGGAGIPVAGNVTYTFSFWAKAGTLAVPKYSVRDVTNAADIVAATSYASLINSLQYSLVRVTFTTAANCATVYLYPIRDGTDTGTIYITRMQLSAGDWDAVYGKTLASIIP